MTPKFEPGEEVLVKRLGSHALDVAGRVLFVYGPRGAGHPDGSQFDYEVEYMDPHYGLTNFPFLEVELDKMQGTKL